jgi:hypothetical protein
MLHYGKIVLRVDTRIPTAFALGERKKTDNGNAAGRPKLRLRLWYTSR